MSSRPFFGNDVEVGMDRGREEGIPDGWLPEQAAIDLAITDNFSEPILTALLQDEELFTSFLETLPSVQHVRSVLNEIQSGNASIAGKTVEGGKQKGDKEGRGLEKTLKQQASLRQAKLELKELEETIKTAHSSAQELSERRYCLEKEELGPETLLKRLKSHLEKTEAASEELCGAFLSKSEPIKQFEVERFVNGFMKERESLHYYQQFVDQVQSDMYNNNKGNNSNYNG